MTAPARVERLYRILRRRDGRWVRHGQMHSVTSKDAVDRYLACYPEEYRRTMQPLDFRAEAVR